MERRQVSGEIWIATELVALGGAVQSMCALLRDDRKLRARVDDHEERLAVLERKPV